MPTLVVDSSAQVVLPRLPTLPAGGFTDRQGPLHLLLHPDVPRWAMLNATGLQVAALCDGQHTVDQITETLASRWRLDMELLQSDIFQCLLDLQRAGFFHAGQDNPEDPGWGLQINLTERCNLHCLHCGASGGSRAPDRLSTTTIRNTINRAVDCGATSIDFSGGEPLLRPDCLGLLGDAARRVNVSLATNATLLDGDTAAELVRMGIGLQVSLDGAEATTHDAIRGRGAFDRAWRGIDRLVRLGAGDRLVLNMTMMRSNLAQVPDIISLAAERGVRSVRLVPVQRLGRATRHWDEIAPSLEEMRQVYRQLYSQALTDRVVVNKGFPGLVLDPPVGRMWCRLGKQLVMDARGDLYPCGLLTQRQFRLGNIEQVSLSTALQSERLRQLIALVERRPDEIDECRRCPWRRFCQANCPASIWLGQGSWHAVDGLCDLRRELYGDMFFTRAAV